MTVAQSAAQYRFQGPEDRKRAFRNTIEADAHQKIFNDQFIEGLSRRLDSLTATIRRIDNIGYVILFYLAATVLSLHFSISVFGFSLSESKNARELLLIAWFSLHYYRMTKSREQTYSEELLECLLEKRSGNNTLTMAAMMLRYGIEPGPFQLVQQGAPPGLIRLLLLFGFLFLHLGWQIVIAGIIAIVQIATMVSILRDPSVAEWVSVLVVLYVVSVSLVSFGMSKLYGIGRSKNKPAVNLPDL